MIDIHCHILPEVDDGAGSIEEACAMVSLAAEGGTTVMVATPHYYNDFQCITESSREIVTEKYRLLKQRVVQLGLPVKLYLGSEQFGISDISSLSHSGELIPINGSRYVLVEFDFEDSPDRVRFCLSRLIRDGFIPIVAHPERYIFLQENPHIIYGILEMGCLLQINKGSPLGRYGSEEEKLVWWLLEKQAVHFVASDCHGTVLRTPDMSEAYNLLSRELDADYTAELFYENPASVLRNDDIL